MHIEIGQKNFPLMVNAYDKPTISNNGNLALLINGFKDAVEQHINFIKEFLIFTLSLFLGNQELLIFDIHYLLLDLLNVRDNHICDK